jgi:RNA-directed DNA polymerase
VLDVLVLQITHLARGVDFLGFTIRRFPKSKLLTKRSNEALRRIWKRLSTEMRALRTRTPTR